MKRISLVPLAAVLFFAETATSFSADSPVDASAWARAINLMPLIDPEKDTVKGTWRIEKGKLLSGSNMHERIVIPYEPPGEYDFRIVFCRMSGEESVVQYVSQAGRMALWLMGGGRDRIFGFELVNGKMAGSNQTTVRRDRGIQVEQVHTSALKVRRDGVKAYLDGELITQWQTDFSDARLDRRWDLPDQRLLGVGSWRSPTAFHKIELLEITGRGKALRGVVSAVTAVSPQLTVAVPQSPPAVAPSPAAALPATTPQATMATRPVVIPAVGSIQLEVNPITQKKNLALGAGNVATFVQTRSLSISVRNLTPHNLPEVVVRWGVVKASLGTGTTASTRPSITAYGKEETIGIKPLETRVIQTPAVQAGGQQWNYRSAEGEKIMGHGVQAIVGGRVLAEEFMPPTIKSSFENLKPIERKK